MNRFDIGPWWLVLAVAALDLSAMARALLRGHGVSSTLAWLCAVLAFPGLGAIAYLSLANPSVRRTVRKRASVALATPDVRAPGPAVRDEMGLFHLATSLTGIAPTTGNRVNLLVEEAGAFERIEAALLGAKDSIWAEYCIVRNDETGHRFLDLLATHASVGVRVHLLYDALRACFAGASPASARASLLR